MRGMRFRFTGQPTAIAARNRFPRRESPAESYRLRTPRPDRRHGVAAASPGPRHDGSRGESRFGSPWRSPGRSSQHGGRVNRRTNPNCPVARRNSRSPRFAPDIRSRARTDRQFFRLVESHLLGPPGASNSARSFGREIHHLRRTPGAANFRRPVAISVPVDSANPGSIGSPLARIEGVKPSLVGVVFGFSSGSFFFNHRIETVGIRGVFFLQAKDQSGPRC